MFKNLGIGAKISTFVSGIVLVALVVLGIVLGYQINKNSVADAEKMLQVAAARYGNYVQGIFNESQVSLQGAVISINKRLANNASKEDIFASLDEKLDASNWGKYAFLYIENYNGESIKYLSQDLNQKSYGDVKEIPNQGWVSELAVIKTALKEKKPHVGITQIFNINGTSFFGVALAQSVQDKNGNNVGVAGILLNLEEVSNLITSNQFSLFKGDLRVLLTQNARIAAHTDRNIWAKIITDVNTNAAEIAQAIKNKTPLLITDNFVSYEGESSYLALKEISFQGIDESWYIMTTAPKKEVLSNFYSMITLIAIATIIIIIIVTLVVNFAVRKIVGDRIVVVLNYLHGFFEFLAHKPVKLEAIKVRANDELGKMAMMINKYVDVAKKDVEEDQKIVKESLRIIDIAKTGIINERNNYKIYKREYGINC